MTVPLDPVPPCVVCGAEGGNCGPKGDKPDHVLFHEWGGDLPTPSSRHKEKTMPSTIIATERVYEILPIPRSSRQRRVLRYAVGQPIPAAEAKRLNVKANGTQTKVPTSPPDGVTVPLAARKKTTVKRTVKKGRRR